MTAHARAMGAALSHRGPDDRGAWVDAEAGLSLSHTRLAILDLSPAGAQPMHSPSGRHVLVFNGEVYNHLELREQLQHPPAWRGHSDTETLLACIDAWGLADTLTRCVGMFALAVWDRQDRVLRLARDRLGEKPLYVGWQGNTLLFGSELKALRAHPDFVGDLNHHAVALMTRYKYVPAPHCVIEGITKLLPGHVLEIRQPRPGHLPDPVAYWTPWAAVGAGTDTQSDDREAVDMLDALLSRAVRQQCLADVPLGGLLSGGVDSSAIVALMQRAASGPVRTFTIGFHEQDFNEAEYAEQVARHLGTRHETLYITPGETLELIPNLPRWFDEPQGDYSSIPTYLVSRLARQHVTVALSGDGGDELFCGYQRYQDNMRRLRVWNALPDPLRRALAAGLSRAPGPERLQRVAQVMAAQDRRQVYDCMMASMAAPVPGHAWAGGQPPLPASLAVDDWSDMMLNDLLQYLPDQVLAKVDRASMAVSLETRAPMLDHRVVEFALRQPLHRKLRNGQSKWLLRQVLYRDVPPALIERPKMGFTVPICRWLRGPLADWAESLLAADSLARADCLDTQAIRGVWSRFKQGDDHPAQWLWNVLVFQQWLSHW